jgi:hypothetical protein
VVGSGPLGTLKAGEESKVETREGVGNQPTRKDDTYIPFHGKHGVELSHDVLNRS